MARATYDQFSQLLTNVSARIGVPLTYTADGEPTRYQVWTTTTPEHGYATYTEVTRRGTLTDVCRELEAIHRAFYIRDDRPHCPMCKRDATYLYDESGLCSDCHRAARQSA